MPVVAMVSMMGISLLDLAHYATYEGMYPCNTFHMMLSCSPHDPCLPLFHLLLLLCYVYVRHYSLPGIIAAQIPHRNRLWQISPCCSCYGCVAKVSAQRTREAPARPAHPQRKSCLNVPKAQKTCACGFSCGFFSFARFRRIA